MDRTLRIGTRGSRLALAQVEIVREFMAPYQFEIEPVVIRTRGDDGDRDHLGAFTSRIQDAVIDGTVDAALHCLKDLPTTRVPELTIAAYLPRENAADCLIVREPDQPINPGSVIGTGALRRTAQLRRLYPDAVFRTIYGNVDTRLAKLADGEYDALVLAHAGLTRLGQLRQRPHRVLSFTDCLPAAGQGTLVLETRRDGPDLSDLDDAATRRASLAERALLAAFGTGCRLPIAAYAEDVAGRLSLIGRVLDASGTRMLERQAFGRDPETLGLTVADALKADGALDLLGGRA